MDWYFNNNKQSANKIKELIYSLNHATKEYDEGHPSMSDKEWDNLYFELEKLEKETGIIYPDSPTQKVFFEEVSSLNKVEHNHQMLSLDKTKNPDEVQSFVNGHEWLAMFKMDGLTVSLTYEKGELVKAETRGNGLVGEDIWHNAIHIKDIPLNIPEKNRTIIVDGGVICTFTDFEPFEKEYKNPRNFAAGSIRLFNSEESAARNLSFVAWDLIEGSDEDFFMYRLEQLDHWGFITVPRVGDAETVEDAIGALDRMFELNFSTYPIDGYVFKFESVKYGKSLGQTDHHFKNAIAFKFYDEEYDTKLKYIDWTMGRTGVLTPVAVFEPIEIDGSTVERASLHNYSIMREVLGSCAYVGEPLKVYKANQIIPQIKEAGPQYDYGYIVSHGGVSANDTLEVCPYCGGIVTIKESAAGVQEVVCTNPNCQGLVVNRIDHFFGKKGLDVKGISKKTIEKLIDWGWVNGLTDIYKLNGYRAVWVSKTGFGEASVDKILLSIDASRSGASLENFISALGIPLIGRTIAKEITKYYSTWEDFRAAVGGDWTEFDGFGPEISKAINNFDYTEADEIATHFLTFKAAEAQVSEESTSAIKDKVFCVTGKLTNYTRDSIKTEIESLGGKVVGSISSKVNYLITNTPNSGTSKNRDAQKYNIPIITEEEYRGMIK